MKTQSTYTTDKKQACFEIDSEIRSFAATCKAWQKYAKNKPEQFARFANMDGITIDLFNMDYIREHLPKRFDNNGKLCTLKNIELDEVCNWDGFHVVTLTDKAVVYIPKYKFTTNEVYALIKNAKNAKKAVEKAVEKARKQAEKKDKEIARLARLEKECEKLRANISHN